MRKELEATREFLKRKGLWRKERVELKNCVKDKVCDKCDKVRGSKRQLEEGKEVYIKKRLKSARGRPASRSCQK